jgi:hypothetical protein
MAKSLCGAVATIVQIVSIGRCSRAWLAIAELLPIADAQLAGADGALRRVPQRRRLVERDRDEARAEQHKTRCGQGQKSIGDEIVTTHDAPAVFPMIARLY